MQIVREALARKAAPTVLAATARRSDQCREQHQAPGEWVHVDTHPWSGSPNPFRSGRQCTARQAMVACDHGRDWSLAHLLTSGCLSSSAPLNMPCSGSCRMPNISRDLMSHRYTQAACHAHSTAGSADRAACWGRVVAWGWRHAAAPDGRMHQRRVLADRRLADRRRRPAKQPVLRQVTSACHDARSVRLSGKLCCPVISDTAARVLRNCSCIMQPRQLATAAQTLPLW